MDGKFPLFRRRLLQGPGHPHVRHGGIGQGHQLPGHPFFPHGAGGNDQGPVPDLPAEGPRRADADEAPGPRPDQQLKAHRRSRGADAVGAHRQGHAPAGAGEYAVLPIPCPLFSLVQHAGNQLRPEGVPAHQHVRGQGIGRNLYDGQMFTHACNLLSISIQPPASQR